VNSALLAMLDVSLGDMATETTDRVNEDIAAHPEVGETLTRWLEKLPQSEAQPHANLGRIRSASADWAGTVEALTRACEIDPTKAVYACGLGVAHLKLGQHAEAEQQLANALTMNFGDDEELEELTHHAHGVALLGLGKTAEAKEGLR
jgi:tetratricopeptide (TPR) repeat protein